MIVIKPLVGVPKSSEKLEHTYSKYRSLGASEKVYEQARKNKNPCKEA